MIIEYTIEKTPCYVNDFNKKDWRILIGGLHAVYINKFYKTKASAKRALKIMASRDFGHIIYNYTK